MSTGPDGSLFALLFVLIGIIGLVTTGIWIWMLVDCVTNEPSGGNDKIIWILIIVLVGWLGALVYLFARRPQRISQFGK